MGTKGHSGRRTGVSRGVMRVSHGGRTGVTRGVTWVGEQGKKNVSLKQPERFRHIFMILVLGPGGAGYFRTWVGRGVRPVESRINCKVMRHKRMEGLGGLGRLARLWALLPLVAALGACDDFGLRTRGQGELRWIIEGSGPDTRAEVGTGAGPIPGRRSGQGRGSTPGHRQQTPADRHPTPARRQPRPGHRRRFRTRTILS